MLCDIRPIVRYGDGVVTIHATGTSTVWDLGRIAMGDTVRRLPRGNGDYVTSAPHHQHGLEYLQGMRTLSLQS